MPAKIVPIIDETSKVIGLWTLNPTILENHIENRVILTSDLLGLAEPILGLLSRQPVKKVENSTVMVGNDCGFENGCFLMFFNEPAPNEELSKPDSKVAYLVGNTGGTAILERVPRSDPRIHKAPPLAGPPPLPRQVSHPQGKKHLAAQLASSVSAQRRTNTKKWWHFWK